MSSGYIKLHRKILDNPRMADPDYLAVWVRLLIEAAYTPKDAMFGGQRITLKPGQLTIGRRKFGELSGVNEHKVDRILACFENEHQIEQQTSNTNRLISITNWYKYQTDEQQNEQRMSNGCATDEQQVSTSREVKKERKKEEKNKKTLSKANRFGYMPDTGPDGLPQIGEERSVLYKGIAHAWWVAHKAGRGEYPTWTKWTNSGIEELERLGKPIEDYRSVFSYSFKDDFWKNAASYESVYKNWDALYAKSKSSQQPQDKPIDLLKQIAEDRRRNEINDNEGY